MLLLYIHREGRSCPIAVVELSRFNNVPATSSFRNSRYELSVSHKTAHRNTMQGKIQPGTSGPSSATPLERSR